MSKKLTSVITLALSILLVTSSLAGCGKKQTESDEWIESEVISVIEDNSSTDGSGASGQESKQPSDSAQSASKNSSPEKLKNPNVTVCWPRTTDDHPEFAAVNKAFEKKYGGKVTVVGTGKYDDRAARLTNLVQSKTQVDVVFSGMEDFPSYATTNLVRPIDTSKFDFSKAPYDINNKKNSYTKLNGNTYFVKTDDTTGGYVLLYNKTLFENAGLKTPAELYKEGNWTWDTFRDAARNLTQDTNSDGKNDVYGFADYDINALLCSNGVSLLNYDGSKFSPNTDARVKRAYQLYYDMYNVDKSICTDPWSWSTDMVQGKLGMVCQKVSQLLYWKSQTNKYEFDLAPLPKGVDANEHYAALNYENCFAIGATCKNADGAYAYIKFYIEQTQGKLYNEKTAGAKLNANQEKMLKEISALTANPYSPTGFGSLKNDATSLLWDIRGGKSVGSALEFWHNVLKQDIDIAMKNSK